MGDIDVRRWFELLERRVLCSASDDVLATFPSVIDNPPANVVLPPPLTGNHLPASSTTILQYISAQYIRIWPNRICRRWHDLVNRWHGSDSHHPLTASTHFSRFQWIDYLRHHHRR